MTPPHPKFDALFRKLVEHPKRARLLLKACLPPDIAKDIAGKPKTLKAGHVLPDGRRIEADAVFLVRLSGKQRLVALLEHKSAPDPGTLGQIWHYLGALHFGDGVGRRGQRPNLPVLPIVLYHGRARWSAPRSLADIVDSVPGVAAPVDWRLYRVVRFADLDRSVLAADPRVLAAVTVLAMSHFESEEVGDGDVDRIAAGFAVSGFGRYLYRSAHELLKVGAERLEAAVMRLKPEMEGHMPTIADQYRQQGRVEGRVEGQVKTLTRLLTTKYGNDPEWDGERFRKRIRDADEGELDRLTDLVLTSRKLDDIFD